jgi:hypothetical protein
MGYDMLSSFQITGEIILQVIRKEKDLQNAEHDKQFYEDNGPQGPAKAHALKTLKIE